MLERLIELRARLDRLAAAHPRRPGLLGSWLKGGDPPQPVELLAVDEGLDRAGIHTLADAQLLAQLMSAGARAGEPGRGLARRVGRAAAEFERVLGHEERRVRREGRPSHVALARLEDLFTRLSRAVRVAAVLQDPKRLPEDLFAPLPRPVQRLPAPSDPRVAVAEFLASAGGSATLEGAQRRRHLDAAHELLLRLGSDVERDRVRSLRARVAFERAGPAGSAASPVETASTIEQAIGRGEGEGAWSAAVELYRQSLDARDASMAGASRRLLSALEGSVAGGLPRACDESRARELLEEAGPEGAIAAAVREQRRDGGRDDLAALALELETERWATFELSLGAGRFFDVDEGPGELEEPDWGGPVRYRKVPHPAAVMTVDVAQSVSELPQFVIGDPRTVLYDLASQRQLVRAWLAPIGRAEGEGPRRKGSVRVYVCDASGSMKGARQRFRDAVLIAELNDLSVREARQMPRAPLYFSFFTDNPTALERVDDSAAALDAVRALSQSSPAAGKTDITYALESAFSAIRDARGLDRDLGRATVVLVTDGEDRVDLERIEAARAPLGEIEVTLSFISLGNENPDLKQLVLGQRGAGKRAFYYHLSDDEIALARTAFEAGTRTLLPEFAPVVLAPEDPQLAAAVRALSEVAQSRRAAVPADAPGVRFDQLFPPSAPDRVDAPVNADLDQCADLLAAVSEASALAPWEVRAGEAVLLIEHLLRVYGWTTAQYQQALPSLPARGREALERIRMQCPSPGERTWG